MKSPDKPVDKTPWKYAENSAKAHEIVGFRLDPENPLVAGVMFELTGTV
jgi:hypothetical protein